jgi:hypothetical protein
MRFRLVSAALALCAVAGFAKADLTWDSVVRVPALETQPGQFLVCPPDSRFDTHEKPFRCVKIKGGWIPESVGAPKLMTLQAAVDLHLKLHAGERAIAQGPLRVFTRDLLDEDNARVVDIAYKIVKQ